MSDQQPPQPERLPSPDVPPSYVPEVPPTKPRRRHVVRARMGFVLIVLGFLAFVGSYVLLPLYVVCYATCGAPEYSTAWELSLYGLSNFPDRGGVAANILLLCFLPLPVAVMVVGGSIGFLLHPHRWFATWNFRACLVGISAVGILFLYVGFLNAQPEIGYAGMLLGYGLLLGGNRLFLTVYP